MALRKGDIAELFIEKAAYGGHGIAHHDGLVVFVRGAVPGDRVGARVFRKKKGYAEARVVEVLTPSPDRTVPPCPYFGYCGGCQWQQVAYHRQRDYKKDMVREALEHIGNISPVTVLDTLPSDHLFAYRNKMEFSFSDRRWYLPGDFDPDGTKEPFALGLHVPGTFNKVLDMDACLLQKDAGNRILMRVKAFARDSGLRPYGITSHLGFWRYLALRHSLAHDEWMVNLVTSGEAPKHMEALATLLHGTGESIGTIVNNVTARTAAVAVGDREITVSGRGYLLDAVGPYTFQVSANSFFQTNPLGAERLYRTVERYAELTGTETVLDLYSGTGTIPIFLAHGASTVTGIEITESAVMDARKNCEDNGIDNCRFVCADIRDALATLTITPDVVIVDPPRAGMHKDVRARLMDVSADRIVYVSCNPATLARDVGEMMDHYELLEVQPVDMFPHTYHIEAVAVLSRRSRTKIR